MNVLQTNKLCFVQLVKMSEVNKDDAGWQQHVAANRAGDYYTFAEAAEAKNHLYVVLGADEIEFMPLARMVGFITVPFYSRFRMYDPEVELIVRHKATGKVYARWREEMGD